MKVKIVLDGVTYESKTSLEDAEEIANQHYKNADTFTTFMMTLDTGEFLVLGPEAYKRAIFLYVPNP